MICAFRFILFAGKVSIPSIYTILNGFRSHYEFRVLSIVLLTIVSIYTLLWKHIHKKISNELNRPIFQQWHNRIVSENVLGSSIQIHNFFFTKKYKTLILELFSPLLILDWFSYINFLYLLAEELSQYTINNWIWNATQFFNSLYQNSLANHCF